MCTYFPSRYETLVQELSNIFSHAEPGVECKAVAAAAAAGYGVSLGTFSPGIPTGDETAAFSSTAAVVKQTVGASDVKEVHSQEVQTDYINSVVINGSSSTAGEGATVGDGKQENDVQ